MADVAKKCKKEKRAARYPTIPHPLLSHQVPPLKGSPLPSSANLGASLYSLGHWETFYLQAVKPGSSLGFGTPPNAYHYRGMPRYGA